MFRKACAAKRATAHGGHRAMLECHAQPVQPRLRTQRAQQLHSFIIHSFIQQSV